MGYFFKNSEVSLQTPNQGMVDELLTHFSCFPDFDSDLFLTDCNEFSIMSLFNHPVWWAPPGGCNAEVFSECFCGRVSLLDVLLELHSPEERHEAYAQHRETMSAAFNHYWSGDSLTSGSIFDVCPSCIAVGSDHISLVGFEAHQLALELGEALAGFNPDFSSKFS